MGLTDKDQNLFNNNSYQKALKRIFYLAFNRLINPFYWSDWIYNLFSSEAGKFQETTETLREFSRKVREREREREIKRKIN